MMRSPDASVATESSVSDEPSGIVTVPAPLGEIEMTGRGLKQSPATMMYPFGHVTVRVYSGVCVHLVPPLSSTAP